MSSLPQVRASWLKYTVRSSKNYAAPEGPRILDAIGAELRAEIRKAGPLSWMPAEHFIALCAAIRTALGVQGARAFWKKSLHDSIQQPLIRPLAMGGLYLFGHSPAGLYRRTPQAWALVTRRTGEMSTEPGPDPDSLRITVTALPEEARSQALLNMWEGGFVGQAQFVDCHAKVETHDEQLTLGNATFLVRWQTARE
jgi:hypothetical protein